MRIFTVIDDNSTELEYTSQQLLALMPGSEVLKADSGETALEMLFERRLVPSLIFLDFKMGNGMNGLQFLGHIREAHWLEGVPVAMVTEPVKDSELVTCYRMGICSFLSKPVQGFELREAIRDFAQPAMELQAASIVRRSSSDWRYKSAA